MEKILKLYSLLKEKGFDTLDHVTENNMNYSSVADFRDKPGLCQTIVDHDLGYVSMADVLVVVADSPSYGTAMEMCMAKRFGKKIILLASNPIPTPWPIHFSDYLVSNIQELYKTLDEIREKNQ
ncbi:MAG: hypothetical protein M3162_04855 [Thermoproteota archaeon]|nr:hypothetical protein [Thermoproteota archaeon]